MNGASRLRLIAPEELTEEQRRFYDSALDGHWRGTSGLVDSQGRLGGPLRALVYVPDLAPTLQAVSRALRRSSLSRRLIELVILTVGHHVDSEYEVAVHEPISLDVGLTQQQLTALRERRDPDLDDPVEQTVWRTTVRLLDVGDLDDAAYDQAIGALGERGLIELITLIGFYRMIALMLQVFRIPVEG
jgi:4-carboxymuconolactone decarboxylase